jgi:hypothetical protein
MLSRAWFGVAFAAISVALVPALSACSGVRDAFPTKTVTATAAPSTTPTTSRQDAIRAWHNAALVPLQEIRDAADKIVKAAEAFDLTAMGIACQEQHDAVEQVQQHMPSPDPDLTAQLQKALSDYSAATTICTTAVVNRNLDDFAQGTTLLGEANTYLDNAAKILGADLGESPDSPTPPIGPSPSQALIKRFPGTDSQGFIGYAAARCDSGNEPALMAQTTKSLVVVCEAGPGNYYYRGVRLSDGASIELANAVHTSSGFDVTNPTDGTQYQVRPDVLNIISGGQVDSEPMVQYASS